MHQKYAESGEKVQKYALLGIERKKERKKDFVQSKQTVFEGTRSKTAQRLRKNIFTSPPPTRSSSNATLLRYICCGELVNPTNIKQ